MDLILASTKPSLGDRDLNTSTEVLGPTAMNPGRGTVESSDGKKSLRLDHECWCLKTNLYGLEPIGAGLNFFRLGLDLNRSHWIQPQPLDSSMLS